MLVQLSCSINYYANVPLFEILLQRNDGKNQRCVMYMKYSINLAEMKQFRFNRNIKDVFLTVVRNSIIDAILLYVVAVKDEAFKRAIFFN